MPSESRLELLVKGLKKVQQGASINEDRRWESPLVNGGDQMGPGSGVCSSRSPFNGRDLVENAPQPDPATGLYSEEDAGDHPMNEYKLQLSATKEMSWEAKHTPVITFRYAFLSQIFVYLSHPSVPNINLRQRFWRQYLIILQCDTDDTNTMSHLELTSMLGSLSHPLLLVPLSPPFSLVSASDPTMIISPYMQV
jgi:hypothetical protein